MIKISFHFGNIDMVSELRRNGEWSELLFYEPYSDDAILESIMEFRKEKVGYKEFSEWSMNAYNQWCLEHGYVED